MAAYFTFVLANVGVICFSTARVAEGDHRAAAEAKMRLLRARRVIPYVIGTHSVVEIEYSGPLNIGSEFVTYVDDKVCSP